MSESTTAILKASKSDGTWQQYEVAFRKWNAFCQEKLWSMWEPNIEHVLYYLTHLYEAGLSYSTINSNRSALSHLFGEVQGTSVGEHKLIVNFMKGVSKLRPAAPRYSVTWNPDLVLSYIQTWDTKNCDLKKLSLKLVSLLALSTGQRVQSLASIKVSDIVWTTPIQIKLSKVLKTTSITKSNPVLVLPYFTQFELCPARTLLQYRDSTHAIRNDSDLLFLSIAKPHKPVGSQTLSKWLVNVLKLAGVDTGIFHAHSFRHASTSKASNQGVNIDTILKRVGWSMESQTFAKYYKRPYEEVNNFAEKVLSLSKVSN